MSDPFATNLSQAENHLATVNRHCVGARSAALQAQQQAISGVLHYHATTKKCGLEQPDGATKALAGRRLDAKLKLQKAAGDAADMRTEAEKERKQAAADVSEAHLENDSLLATQGKLSQTPLETGDDAVLQWRKRVESTLANPSAMQEFPALPPLANGLEHSRYCSSKPNPRSVKPRIQQAGTVCGVGSHYTAIRAQLAAESRNTTTPRCETLGLPCECAVRAAFLSGRACSAFAKGFHGFNLRLERVRWDPSNFPVDFREQAEYVCDVLDDMLMVVYKP